MFTQPAMGLGKDVRISGKSMSGAALEGGRSLHPHLRVFDG